MAASTITLKLFAAYRETLGQSELTYTLETGATVAVVLADLVAQHPVLERWVSVTRFAVNQSFVDPSHILQPGDELVFIPPVSGG